MLDLVMVILTEILAPLVWICWSLGRKYTRSLLVFRPLAHPTNRGSYPSS